MLLNHQKFERILCADGFCSCGEAFAHGMLPPYVTAALVVRIAAKSREEVASSTGLLLLADLISRVARRTR